MAHSLELEMLAELADATPPTLKQMPVSYQRKYNRSAVCKTRSAVKSALAAGIVKPTKPHIREALADAAIAILKNGGEGSDEIMRVLTVVFSSHAGTTITVAAHVKSGQIKAKFYKSS